MPRLDPSASLDCEHAAARHAAVPHCCLNLAEVLLAIVKYEQKKVALAHKLALCETITIITI